VTEEQIAEFTDCGEEAVNEAVTRAKAAFEAGVWSELPGRARARSCGASPTSLTNTPRNSRSSTR
jgi:acyl-CoA reductase-like NAD-dependent aldehyde dehydrogenase